MLRRFIDEILHPAKKCARIGHAKPRIDVSTWFVDPYEAEKLDPAVFTFGAVAIVMKRKIKICVRCKKHLDIKWSEMYEVQNLSMSQASFEEFMETGKTRRS